MQELVNNYMAEAKEIANDLSTPRMAKKIAKVVYLLYKAWVEGKTIFACGNGGSAATASHFCSDLSKLGIHTHCLDDNISEITAITNDSGFENLYVEQLVPRFKKGDVLVCFSVHGGVERGKEIWSGNLMKAIEYVQFNEGKVIGIVGFEGGIINRIADASIKISSLSTPMVESWHCHILHLLRLILEKNQPVKACDSCGLIRNYDAPRCKCGGFKYQVVVGIIGNIAEVGKIANSKVSS